MNTEAQPQAEDLYARLGLGPDATAKDIKRGFRAAAARYHPDSSAEHRDGLAFQRLVEARDVLLDAVRRYEYDLAHGHREEVQAPVRVKARAPTRTRRVDEPTWVTRNDPWFERALPWMVLLRNAAIGISIIGNLFFLNAMLATDAARLLDEWRSFLTWNVVLLESLYVLVPVTLHLLVVAMTPDHVARR